MSLEEADYVYLHTPDGVIHQVPEEISAASRQVGELLAVHDWVDIRRRGVPEKTRWTVMQRNTSGIPEFITVEEWQGGMAVHDMQGRNLP